VDAGSTSRRSPSDGSDGEARSRRQLGAGRPVDDTITGIIGIDWRRRGEIEVQGRLVVDRGRDCRCVPSSVRCSTGMSGADAGTCLRGAGGATGGHKEHRDERHHQHGG